MKNLNVLLVEDNQINQLIAGRLLRKWGMGVTIANDGKEALAMITCKSFQLILMDLQMPEMDGFESATKIRSMDDVYFKNIPILAFTTSSMINVLDKAKQCGIDDFVSKPLVSIDFQNKISKYINPKKNLALQQQPLQRPLSIDFNRYTEGDEAFKHELLLIMISNIYELMQGLQKGIEFNDMGIFRKIYHKVQPALAIIDDKEFMDVIQELKFETLPSDKRNTDISLFTKLGESIIRSLEEEYK
jgi:CheY-like chemotaxis protein